MKKLKLGGIFIIGIAVGASLIRFGFQRSEFRSVTELSFNLSESDLLLAIETAFANRRYKGMMINSPKAVDGLVSDWTNTNGFMLYTFHEPISTVEYAGMTGRTRLLPYIAYFHISVAAEGAGRSKLSVRTVFSQVIDGTVPSFHGGASNRYRKVSPSLREEYDVLMRVIAETCSKVSQTAGEAQVR